MNEERKALRELAEKVLREPVVVAEGDTEYLPVGHPDHAPIPKEYVSRERYEELEAEVERLKADVQAAKDGQRCCHGCPDCVGIGVRHELDWRQERLDKAEHLLGRWMRGDVIPEVTAAFLQENTETPPRREGDHA